MANKIVSKKVNKKVNKKVSKKVNKKVVVEERIDVHYCLSCGGIVITNANDVVASVVAQVEEKEEVVVAPDLSAIEVEKKGKKEEEGVPAAEGAAPAKEEKTEKKPEKK